MIISLRGEEIRLDELEFDIDVDFKDLNEKGQRRMLLKEKNLFLWDALNSNNIEIYELAKKLINECSSQVLNEIIKKLIVGKKVYDEDKVLMLLKSPNLQLLDELRSALAISRYDSIRIWVASDNDTPSIYLTNMFFEEISNVATFNSEDVFCSIIRNPNFEFSSEMKEKLREEYCSDVALKVFSKVKELTN